MDEWGCVLERLKRQRWAGRISQGVLAGCSTGGFFWYDAADTTSPPAKFLSLPRVNDNLPKTIIHLSFNHSFLAFLALFFAGLDFWPLHFWLRISLRFAIIFWLSWAFSTARPLYM